MTTFKSSLACCAWGEQGHSLGFDYFSFLNDKWFHLNSPRQPQVAYDAARVWYTKKDIEKPNLPSSPNNVKAMQEATLDDQSKICIPTLQLHGPLHPVLDKSRKQWAIDYSHEAARFLVLNYRNAMPWYTNDLKKFAKMLRATKEGRSRDAICRICLDIDANQICWNLMLFWRE